MLASRYVAGTGWGSAVPIETDNAGLAFAPQLVIDGTGNVPVLWEKRNLAGYTNDSWTNRYTTATGWGQAFILDGTSDPATDVQIGMDGSGDVLAVWQQDHFVRSIWADAYTSAGSP